MTEGQIQTGDRAPEFSLKNQENKTASPMAMEGSRILLSFHPLAWTAVCEIQMRTLELKKSVFDELDVLAYGISVDSVQCKKAWADAIGVTETNLLADFWPHGDIARKYGLFLEDKGISNRANVLIGPDHTVQWVKVYEILQVPDIEEVVDVIRSKT